MPPVKLVYTGTSGDNDLDARYGDVAGISPSAPDNASAIQAALNRARDAATDGMREVAIRRPGTYDIKSPLLIYSNTRLHLWPGVTIRRAAAIDNMLRNGADGVTGGYTASQNIEVVGGTWDANSSGFAVGCTAIAFGHATGVSIRDLVIKNIYQYHHIELNAVKRGRVTGCTFQDYGIGSATFSEAVQLDLMLGAGQFPWFGPYDNTPCTEIEIRGNVFTGTLSRAVGSHSSAAGVTHTKIVIRDNTIENCRDEAINALNYADVTITGNRFTNCYQGVHAQPDGATICAGWLIADNIFSDFQTYNPTQARAIWMQGTPANRAFVRGTITGNVVRSIGRHGITVDNGDHWVIAGNSVHTIGSATAGSGLGISAASSNYVSIGSNIVEAAWDVGVFVFSGTGATVSGNMVRACGNYGIDIDTATQSTVSGNTVTESTGQSAANGYGIVLKNSSTNVVVSGNVVRECQADGIRIDGSTQNSIANNIVTNCSRHTDLAASGITLTTNASTNNVQGNTVRSAGSGNRHQYGINIATSNCSGNVVTNNDLLTAGITNVFNNAGTGTITAAGNRLA